jgi:hypothetical protein
MSFINAPGTNEKFDSFKNKFSKESIDYYNSQFDGQDPQDLALKFHGIIQITKMMADEY